MIFFRQVDCGGCAPCPTGPCESTSPASPTTQARTASSTLTKCGFFEYTGYESTPPKVYLLRSWAGAMGQKDYDDDAVCDEANLLNDYQIYFSGSVSVNSLDCSTSGLNSYTEYQNGTQIDNGSTTAVPMSNYVAFCSGECDPNTTSTSQEFIPDNTCVGSFPSHKTYTPTTNAKETLSAEYTTSLLVSNVTSTIPDFSGSYVTYSTGTDYAYYDLSTDELTATKTKVQYRFALPDLTGYTCYKITWAEKFVPESGSTVYTALSYTWDGSATYAGPYTIDPPTSQGATTVVSVSVTCSGC